MTTHRDLQTAIRKVCVLTFYGLLVLFTVLFLMPTQYLPEESIFNWWDKAQHAIVFAVLGVAGWFAYPRRMQRLFWSLLAYGALIELLQSLSGWRQGDFLDWGADAIGVILVCGGAWVWQQYVQGRGRVEVR